jgi:hypothetical protein
MAMTAKDTYAHQDGPDFGHRRLYAKTTVTGIGDVAKGPVEEEGIWQHRAIPPLPEQAVDFGPAAGRAPAPIRLLAARCAVFSGKRSRV